MTRPRHIAARRTSEVFPALSRPTTSSVASRLEKPRDASRDEISEKSSCSIGLCFRWGGRDGRDCQRAWSGCVQLPSQNILGTVARRGHAAATATDSERELLAVVSHEGALVELPHWPKILAEQLFDVRRR